MRKHVKKEDGPRQSLRWRPPLHVLFPAIVLPIVSLLYALPQLQVRDTGFTSTSQSVRQAQSEALRRGVWQSHGGGVLGEASEPALPAEMAPYSGLLRPGQSWQWSRVPIFFYQTIMGPMDVLLLNLTRLYNPESAIFLITTANQSMPGEIYKLERELGVLVRYVEHYIFPGTDAFAFRQLYVHWSINPLGYERLCFERFFVMRDIMMMEGLNHLFYMDADTALFTDLDFLWQYALQDFDYVGLTSFTSYFALYHIRGLDKFCQYTLEFYNRPEATIEADVWRHGLLEQNKNLRGTFPLPLAPQFSDMYLFHKFVRDPAINLRSKLLLDDPEVFPSARTIEDIHLLNIQDEDVCMSNDYFGTLVAWQQDKRGLRVPVETKGGNVLWGLHFQGTCKKLMPHIFEQLGFRGVGGGDDEAGRLGGVVSPGLESLS